MLNVTFQTVEGNKIYTDAVVRFSWSVSNPTDTVFTTVMPVVVATISLNTVDSSVNAIQRGDKVYVRKVENTFTLELYVIDKTILWDKGLVEIACSGRAIKKPSLGRGVYDTRAGFVENDLIDSAVRLASGYKTLGGYVYVDRPEDMLLSYLWKCEERLDLSIRPFIGDWNSFGWSVFAKGGEGLARTPEYKLYAENIIEYEISSAQPAVTDLRVRKNREVVPESIIPIEPAYVMKPFFIEGTDIAAVYLLFREGNTGGGAILAQELRWSDGQTIDLGTAAVVNVVGIFTDMYVTASVATATVRSKVTNNVVTTVNIGTSTAFEAIFERPTITTVMEYEQDGFANEREFLWFNRCVRPAIGSSVIFALRRNRGENAIDGKFDLFGNINISTSTYPSLVSVVSMPISFIGTSAEVEGVSAVFAEYDGSNIRYIKIKITQEGSVLNRTLIRVRTQAVGSFNYAGASPQTIRLIDMYDTLNAGNDTIYLVINVTYGTAAPRTYILAMNENSYTSVDYEGVWALIYDNTVIADPDAWEEGKVFAIELEKAAKSDVRVARVNDIYGTNLLAVSYADYRSWTKSRNVAYSRYREYAVYLLYDGDRYTGEVFVLRTAVPFASRDVGILDTTRRIGVAESNVIDLPYIVGDLSHSVNSSYDKEVGRVVFDIANIYYFEDDEWVLADIQTLAVPALMSYVTVNIKDDLPEMRVKITRISIEFDGVVRTRIHGIIVE